MTTINWSENTCEQEDPNFKIKIPVPSSDIHITLSPEKDIEPTAFTSAADQFYNMFKSACHGITRRQELEQLYYATYQTFGSKFEQPLEFSKVLFAMAHTLKVLRVIKGGTISWKAFTQRDDRRDQRDDRPRYDDHQDRRPRFDDRHGRDDHQDRRPRFDDRHGRDDHQDRRPRFDDRHGRDERPRYNNQKQEPHSRAHYTTRDTRAVSVERQ
jgi:hypothetical protein